MKPFVEIEPCLMMSTWSFWGSCGLMRHKSREFCSVWWILLCLNHMYKHLTQHKHLVDSCCNVFLNNRKGEKIYYLASINGFICERRWLISKFSEFSYYCMLFSSSLFKLFMLPAKIHTYVHKMEIVKIDLSGKFSSRLSCL